MNSQTDKSEIRRQIRSRRVGLPDRKQRSEQIQRAVENLPEFQSAKTLMVYLGYRSEVQTDALIKRLLPTGKKVFIPWCDDDELRLFRLEGLEELEPGAFGILEPHRELKRRADRDGQPGELEVVLVPGIAFDRQGARLGQGKGYYDRLLKSVRDDCVLIGLGFSVQIVEQVPTEAHDVMLDLIVTESEVADARQ